MNLPYVFWIAAYNVSFVLGYLSLDLAFFASPLSRSTYSPYSKLKVHPPDPAALRGRTHKGARGAGDAGAPPLLEAINKNGLVLFLLVSVSADVFGVGEGADGGGQANLATGVVNLSMKTMYASDAMAMGVLSLYAVAVCGVAWVFRHRRLYQS